MTEPERVSFSIITYNTSGETLQLLEGQYSYAGVMAVRVFTRAWFRREGSPADTHDGPHEFDR